MQIVLSMINVFINGGHLILSEGIEFSLMDNPSGIWFARSALNLGLDTFQLEGINADVIIPELLIKPTDPVEAVPATQSEP